MAERIKGYLVGVNVEDSSILIDTGEERTWLATNNSDVIEFAENFKGEEVVFELDDDYYVADIDLAMNADPDEELSNSIPILKKESSISEEEAEEIKEQQAEPEAERTSKFFSGRKSSSHPTRDKFDRVETNEEERELRRFCLSQAVALVSNISRGNTSIEELDWNSRRQLGRAIATVAREFERYIMYKFTYKGDSNE